MTQNNKLDEQTLELIKEIQKRKQEIARAEKPRWQTNCSFSYDRNCLNKAINIQVESNVEHLVLIAAFIREKNRIYKETALDLNIEAPPFTWHGYTSKEWIHDICNRINKIQITTKKNKLAELEKRANAIMSPELKTELELQAIKSELK